MDPSEKAAKAAVTEFITAADVQDVTRLKAVLNPVFRASVNQFMGSAGVTIIDRETYLAMVGDKKLGGTPRTVAFKSVEVVGHTAFVRANLDSDALHFEAMLTLAQDKLGDWTITSDTPFTSPK